MGPPKPVAGIKGVIPEGGMYKKPGAIKAPSVAPKPPTAPPTGVSTGTAPLTDPEINKMVDHASAYFRRNFG